LQPVVSRAAHECMFAPGAPSTRRIKNGTYAKNLDAVPSLVTAARTGTALITARRVISLARWGRGSLAFQ
jgi:hypothetical protein